MSKIFEKCPTYIGKCERCHLDLGDYMGVLMGPDREDDTEWYAYDLCLSCINDYNSKIEPVINQFIVEYMNIPPSNFLKGDE